MVHPNNGFYKKLEVDEYIGKAIDNILLFSSAIVAMPSFDLEMIQQKQRYLINQCENLCVGAGYINREKKKVDVQNLTPEELELLESIKKYYSTKPNYFGITIERKALEMLSEAVEGKYDSKIARMKTHLEEKILGKQISNFEADTQIDNYRLQLLIEAIEAKKPKKAEFGI